ncbi:MAG TPA: ATP-binding protein [Methanothrix sp.]|nr:ATP-binding protein [Methanothrix sp.]
MTSRQFEEWQKANQLCLEASLKIIKKRLEDHSNRQNAMLSHAEFDPNFCFADGQSAEDGSHDDFRELKEDSARPVESLNEECWNFPVPAALESLCTAFSLTAFERELLLLCAGVEFQPDIAALCAAAQGDSRMSHPTFALAMKSLQQPHWSAISPSSPLRRWHLIRIGSGDLLTKCPLQIDERVLYFLLGVPGLDERLQGFVEPVISHCEMPSSYEMLAERIVDLQMKSGDALIQLCGMQDDGKRAVAQSACQRMGLQLYAIRAGDIPAAVAEREALARLWEREALFSNSALFVECGQAQEAEGRAILSATISFLQSVQCLILVSCAEPLACPGRLSIRLDVKKPTSAEQEDLWRRTLKDAACKLDGFLGQAVYQFDLGLAGIEKAGAEVLSALSSEADKSNETRAIDCLLWEACRHQARPRLSELAIRIDAKAEWDDLVLPGSQKKMLREIAAQVRQRFRVYSEWGFAAKGARGLGLSALFTGSSGTGKTMAAEVLANELELDLYRIDLSQVVSKYIGETEKNIRRVFDAADEGGAILLFDEADALFGKRSEVKDSHDRYANIEISYLLQRMEAYRGLAILTTNMKKALDTAFMRRIRFIVEFPFPDASQRAEIWNRIFPQQTPLGNIDLARLARLNVAGGSIRNIALYAAFLAAETGERVEMKHLLRAAQVEYGKLERPLAGSEVGGWA